MCTLMPEGKIPDASPPNAAREADQSGDTVDHILDPGTQLYPLHASIFRWNAAKHLHVFNKNGVFMDGGAAKR